MKILYITIGQKLIYYIKLISANNIIKRLKDLILMSTAIRRNSTKIRINHKHFLPTTIYYRLIFVIPL